MPIRLEGSCRCDVVRFALESHTPHPYQLCYCGVCRKTAGGGGYAINIMGVADTLEVQGLEALGVYHASLDGDGVGEPSPAARHFCRKCASALWVFDPSWPELIHPFASAIDSELPVPPMQVHLMLRDKAPWVEPAVAPEDVCFDDYPPQSIEDWHRSRGLWVA